jgi:hypothetical protein
LRYTAREGGGLFAQQTALELHTAINELIDSAGNQGLAQGFSLRNEFPTEWHGFLHPADAGVQTITLDLNKERFPYLFQGKTIGIDTIDLFVKVEPEFAGSHNRSTLKLALAAGGSAPTLDDDPAGNVTLVEWKRLLRAEPKIKILSDPGELTLNAWLDNGNRLSAGALEDILLVCRYSVA